MFGVRGVGLAKAGKLVEALAIVAALCCSKEIQHLSFEGQNEDFIHVAGSLGVGAGGAVINMAELCVDA